MVVQRLIGAGHDYKQIANYSVAQAELFLDAISKEDAESMRNSMIAARGASAANKQFKKMLKELS